MEGVTVFFKRRGTWWLFKQCVLYLNNFMTFEVPWLKPSFPHWFLYPKFEGCRREESSPGVQEHCVASICPVWKRSTYCLCVCIDLSAHWSEPGRARQLLWNHVVSEIKQEAHTFSDSRTLLEARSPAVPWRLQKSALEICNHFVEFVVVWHQKHRFPVVL